MKGEKRDEEAKLRTEGGKKEEGGEGVKLRTHQKLRQWQRLPRSGVRISAENTARFSPCGAGVPPALPGLQPARAGKGSSSGLGWI